jgi:L-fuconate dehydratase
LPVIRKISTADLRYTLPQGAGSDAVHTDPQYCLAVTRLECDSSLTGTGFILTLGEGNRLVCEAIEMLAASLVGKEIEDLMDDFAKVSRSIVDDPVLRWVGPHKGVVHLALASIVNACFDLWAKSRGVPLWRLLLDLTPEQVVRLLDLSYVEDALDRDAVLDLLRANLSTREERLTALKAGYPGYDTSVGWMAYEDGKVRELVQRAKDKGFSAFKLKVGSVDRSRDLRRAAMLRECAGENATIMFDANQRWNLPTAKAICQELATHKPLWIEEPTHPDDLEGHRKLADLIAPVKVATGEHIPNRVVFKNFMERGAMHFVQADCTRLAGVSEFLTVSFLARKKNLPVVPHVGDMGQIHQHLVIFNHVAMGHEALLLEHIPHLRPHFVHPAVVHGGVYRIPQEPGSSTDLKDLQGD